MSAMDGVRLPGERRHKNRLDKGQEILMKNLLIKLNLKLIQFQ